MTTSHLISEQNLQSGLRVAVTQGAITQPQAHRIAYLVHPNASATGIISEQNLQSGLRLAVIEGAITEPQAHRVVCFVRRGEVAGQSRTSPLPEVAAYAGAALVASGLWMLTRDGWHDLATVWRVLIAVAMTVLLGGAAATVGARLAGRVIDAAQARLASVSATLAAMSAALTVGVSTPGYMWAAITLTAASAVAYLTFRGFPAIVTCWFGSVWAVAESPLFPAEHGRPSWAIAVGVVAAVWIALGTTNLISERELVVTLGGFTGLVAAETLVVAQPGFVCVGVAFAVLYAATLFVLYQRHIEVAAIPAAIIATLVPLTVFVRIFRHGVPGGIVLAVGGTLLVVLGAVAMRPKRTALPTDSDSDVTHAARGAG